MRKTLADKIIECYTSTTDGNTWYGGERVLALNEARNSGDNLALRAALDEIYKKDVKKAVKGVITKCAVKSGAYSAISQRNAADALLVTAINLQMIKDSHPKYVVSLDRMYGDTNIDGIRHLHLREFLKSKSL